MKTPSIILIALLFLISCSSPDDEKIVIKLPEHIELPKEIMDSLKGGDIIMRQGGGLMSSEIVKTLNEPVSFSHCGIVIKTDSSLFIMHSIGRDYGDRDGVQPVSFKNFELDAIDSSLCVVRPKVSDSARKRIEKVALEYYDKGYTFDYGFDLTTKDELHCTEFVHDVLDDALDKEIFPIRVINGVQCLMFKDFFNPKYFETVYSMRKIPEISFNDSIQ